MPESRDPNLVERLEALATDVRAASRSASVVRLDQVWTGSEDEFPKSLRSDGLSGLDDIALIRDHGQTYLYSERHMTRQYAEAAARAECEDIRHIIAETVRADSATYPRPTSVESFTEPPFRVSPASLNAAVDGISDDPRYADIQAVLASDGSRFLFSSHHMDPLYAASLAEWIAVGSLTNL